MRLGTSTTMGFNRPHGVKADIPDVVRILAEAGFKVQDMNFHDCSTFPTPLLTDKWESWVDDIGNTAAKYGVEFSQSHLHFYEHLTADAETAQSERDDYRAVYARFGGIGRQVGGHSCSDGSRASDAGRLAER